MFNSLLSNKYFYTYTTLFAIPLVLAGCCCVIPISASSAIAVERKSMEVVPTPMITVIPTVESPIQ